MRLIKNLAHLSTLVLRPLANGRAASDGCVLLLDLGGAASGYNGADVVLEAAEGNEVAVSLRMSVRVASSKGKDKDGDIRIGYSGNRQLRLW